MKIKGLFSLTWVFTLVYSLQRYKKDENDATFRGKKRLVGRVVVVNVFRLSAVPKK